MSKRRKPVGKFYGSLDALGVTAPHFETAKKKLRKITSRSRWKRWQSWGKTKLIFLDAGLKEIPVIHSARDYLWTIHVEVCTQYLIPLEKFFVKKERRTLVPCNLSMSTCAFVWTCKHKLFILFMCIFTCVPPPLQKWRCCALSLRSRVWPNIQIRNI